MSLILKLHFHANWISQSDVSVMDDYKLVTFRMIIQQTRSNWHKNNQHTYQLPRKFLCRILTLFLLTGFPGILLYIA